MIGKQSNYPKPLIDRQGNSLKITRFLLLALLIVCCVAYITVFGGENTSALILAMLGALSVLGVFFALLAAIGFLGFSSRSTANSFAKAFVDNIDEGLLVTDGDSRVVYANAAYGKLVGAKLAKDVRTVERIFSRDPEAAEVVYRLAHAVRSGHASQDEIRLSEPIHVRAGVGRHDHNAFDASQPSGPRWYRLRVRPFNSSDEYNSLAVWQVQDITSDRNHQERVFQNLQYAIDYLDHAPAGFFSANSDGAIVYINATLADWLQLDLTKFTPGSLNLRKFVVGDGEALLSTVKPGPGETRTATIDLDLARADGLALPVRLFHMVPVAADGAPGATRTIVLNRSEEIEGLDAGSSRAAEIRFNRFFNSTPIAIASLNADGKVQRANAAFLKLVKKSADVSTSSLAEGDEIINAFAPEHREALQQSLDKAYAGYSTAEPVEVALNGDKDCFLRVYITGVSSAEPVETDREEVAIVYGVEMTEQRALEEQFAKSQKLQAVGQLAGGIAHDFNNVLTGIIGYSDLLLANHRPSDPSFGDIMAIKQNANRAASLVRQLLAFSRRQTLQPEVLEVPAILDDVSMLLRRLLGDKISLDVVHGRDLWPIKADVSQLEQVVVNLAVNARDAMPDGGSLTVTTQNLTENEAATREHKELIAADYVVISMEDTGTGMPPEVMEQIFEPFFSTKEIGSGTGLGLSTVYGIVKQSGGFIYCDSKVGEGTRFNVYLPRYEPTQQDIEAEQETVVEAAPVIEADLSGSSTIMIVEDEDAVRAFAERALQTKGYTVHTAEDGLDGIDMMEELDGKVDLIVSDVMMPEMDGPAMYMELREKYGDVPIIFASGYAEDAFERNLPEGASFNFLPKPYSLKQLVTKVKEALEEGGGAA